MLSWPYTFETAELRAVVTALGVEPTAVSPLIAVPARDAPASDKTSQLLGQAEADARLQMALLTLAAPVRLLSFASVRSGSRDGWLFLASEVAVIGLQIIGATVGFTPAMSAAELAQLLVRLTGAPDEDEHAAELVPMSILPVLAELVENGIVDRDPVSVPVDQLLSALEAALGTSDPIAGLVALEQDDVITRSADVIELTSRWLERFPYLLDDSRSQIAVVELADALDGYDGVRGLSIIGERGRQRIVRRGRIGGRGFVMLTPLISADLTAEVLRLVAAPRLPRLRSAKLASERVDHWLRPGEQLSGEDSVWRMQTRRELLASLDSEQTAAEAMAILAPLAQIGVATRSPKQPAPERSVIGIGADAAVRWTLEGSRVRWRPLDPDIVEGVLTDVLPESRFADESTAPVRLSPEDFVALTRGLLEHDAGSQLPDSLRALGTSGSATWCSFHPSLRDVEGRSPLWLGFGTDGQIWKFDDLGKDVVAHVADQEQIAAELREALTA